MVAACLACVLAVCLVGSFVAGLLVALGDREVSWTVKEILEREG